MAEIQATDPATDNQAAVAAPEQTSVLTGALKDSAPVQAQPDASPKWTAQLEKELQGDAAFTKFKSISELGKSYKELEGKLGKAIVPPGENASAEDIRAFFQKMGAPDSPDKYTLDTSKLPKELASAELEKNFRTWAHDSGLTNTQASALFDKYNEAMSAAFTSREQLIAVKADQTREALQAEWGANYKANMAHMERAFTRFGSPEVAKLITASGLGNDPAVVKMFAAIGKEIREGPMIDAVGADRPLKSAAEVLYPELAK